MRLRRFVVATLVAALAAPAAVSLAPPAGAAIPTDVFFSEYVEGSGFNKAIEIFNGTGAPIDLGSTGYTLELRLPCGTLAAGDTSIDLGIPSGATVNGSGTRPSESWRSPAVGSVTKTRWPRRPS